MIYLDNAATTRVHPEVLNAMIPYLTDEYGNAGTHYKLGRQSAAAVLKAREQVANVLGCDSEHIIFTSGGSEANNLAIKGVTFHIADRGFNTIISSSVEHDSVRRAISSLVENNKIKLAFHSQNLGVNKDGTVRVDDLEELINKYKTGLEVIEVCC